MSERPDDAVEEPALREVRYEYTPLFPEILTQLRASLLVTTYQAGKLLVLGAHNNQLNISFIDYDRPMGLAVSADRIAIGSRRQMHFLVPAHETQGGDSSYDGCFVPRSSFYTGNIHSHDLAWGSDGLWTVNTLFSCLSTLHDDFSFVPQWRPPFISQLIDQDRCHMNGLALDSGVPRFVTAMSETDTPAGWRPTKATSGVIMHVPSGEVVCRGLSMPHSPRVHQGALWVLNSGYGSLGCVDPNTGRYDTVEAVPGYTRGLAFYRQYAFVGLSRIRETSVFGGVPIAEHRDQLRCGVGVIDLTTGKTVAVFQFHSGVSEIFAVDVLPGLVNPLIAGASVDEQEREVWIVPGESLQRPAAKPRMPIYASRSRSTNDESDDSSHAVASTDSRASADEWIRQALVLRQQGRFAEAVQCYESAIALTPAPATLLVDLGNLRQDQGNQLAAELCYRRALEADPLCIAALQNLGYLLFNLGESERSQDVYDRLLKLAPSPLNKLLASSVLPVVYDSMADIQYWRQRQLAILRELKQSGQLVDATQTLVPTAFFAAYQGLCDRELMQLRGEVICGQDFTSGRAVNDTSSRRRVGFLSAYFRDHTIGRLNVRRLERLSRERIHLTIIYAGSVRDEMVDRYQKLADEFIILPRELRGALQTIAQLNLDVLMHTDVGMDSLTQTLAYSRLAPIQMATWGHPDTTGSRVIDYYLTSQNLESDDQWLDTSVLKNPIGRASVHYTEQLVLLPSLGIDYERPAMSGAAPSGDSRQALRRDLGLPDDRHLYVCPQTLFKFHPEFDRALAQILELDPLAELVLLEGQLPEWTHRLRRRFRRTLPESGTRVRFLPALPRQRFLGLLAAADVILDPPHFGGGNSSLEAIAVGTPVVTLEGPFLRSRITSALYKQIGFTELIVQSLDDYAQLAVRIATDQQVRQQLQKQLIASSHNLYEDPQASRELEECLLKVTQRSPGS